MGRYYDVLGGLRYAFAKFRNGDLIKWTVIYNIAMIAASVLDFVLFFLFFALLFGWTFEDYIVSNANLPLISIIAGLWFVPRFILAAMRASDMKTSKAPGVIDWAHLAIRKFIVNTFCWYDKKLLAPAVVFLGIFLLSVALTVMFSIDLILRTPVGIIAFVLFGISWLIAMFVHTLRTNFADFMYLRGDGEVAKMPRKSYDLVHGKTFEVFLAHLLFGLVCAVAFIAIILGMLILAFIPIVGMIVDIILGITLVFAFAAFAEVFMVDMFRFFSDGGKTKTPSNVKKMSAKRKKPAKKKAGKKRKR